MTTFSPAAILWDMDGTIVDTEPAWIRAERALLRQWGSDLGPTDALDWVGIGLWDLASIFQARGVEMHADDIVAWMTDHVNAEIFQGELDWRPGARELAMQASAAGIVNVLVTMSTRGQAERIIGQFPPGTFSGIVGGDDVARPKPYPDPYLEGAKLAGVDAGNCVAIEDSVTGATAAWEAGAFVIGVPHLIDLTDAPLHHTVSSLEHLDIEQVISLYRSERSS